MTNYSKCYACGTELIPKEIASEDLLEKGAYASVEHIIPNFLGLKLKSSKLLCTSCNNRLGDKVDGPFSNSIFFYNLLNYPRDRGRPNRGVLGKATGTGALLRINKDYAATLHKPSIERNEKGEIESIYAFNEESAMAILRKTRQDLSDEELKDLCGKFSFKDLSHESVKIDFSNVILDIKSLKKGVAKIALNYILHKYSHLEVSEYLIRYVTTDFNDNFLVSWLHPSRPLYDVNESDLFHVIHVVGDRAKKFLYCYIDLFNVIDMVVLINDDYRGESFKDTFAWDVMKGCEKELELDFKVFLPVFFRSEKEEEVQENITRKFTRFLSFVQMLITNNNK